MNRLWIALCGPWRAIAALQDAEARRGAALLFMAAGGVAMTGFAVWALYLVRARPTLAFYLGAGALAIIAIVLTGFAGLLIKRTVKASFGSATFEVSDHVAEVAAKTAAATAAALTPTPPPTVEPGP